MIEMSYTRASQITLFRLFPVDVPVFSWWGKRGKGIGNKLALSAI